MNLNETLEDFKFRLRAKFYSWVIKDPYPELTRWSNEKASIQSLGEFSGLVARFQGMVKPEITPHQAWMDGYNFAKSLMESELK